MPDVRLLLVKRLRKADIKVGSEDRTRESAQDELRDSAISSAEVLAERDKLKKRRPPVGFRL